MSNQLLNFSQTLQKIKRIAYQVYEQNFDEKSIVIAGIVGEGYSFAKILAEELANISQIEVELALVEFDKSAQIQPNIQIHSNIDNFQYKNVVLCDDVLNTGKTLAFSLHPFLSVPIKKLQIAVIVDRNHPQYPVSADFVGYSLSTTLTEHIKVNLDNSDTAGVFLY